MTPSSRRLLPSFVLLAALAGMLIAALPAAAYEHPLSAGDPSIAGDGPLRVPLVPAFTQCGTGGNPVNGNHQAPFSVGSCAPPTPTGVAAVTPSSVGSVTFTTVPPGGGAGADITAAADITGVICGPAAPPSICSGVGNFYQTALKFVARLRITDLRNCQPAGCSGPYASAGTTTDFDLSEGFGGSGGGHFGFTASCNAFFPGCVIPGANIVTQVFRVHINDVGPDGVFGTADDKLFEMQGLYNP